VLHVRSRRPVDRGVDVRATALSTLRQATARVLEGLVKLANPSPAGAGQYPLSSNVLIMAGASQLQQGSSAPSRSAWPSTSASSAASGPRRKRGRTRGRAPQPASTIRGPPQEAPDPAPRVVPIRRASRPRLPTIGHLAQSPRGNPPRISSRQARRSHWKKGSFARVGLLHSRIRILLSRVDA
jgi:hypothetical protein